MSVSCPSRACLGPAAACHDEAAILSSEENRTMQPRTNRPLRLPSTQIALAMLVASFTSYSVAAPTAAVPAPAGCKAAEYHLLDFWIGDWDTYEADAPAAQSEARTHVSPIAQGCAIHELYEQADGLIGDSILSYDPVRKQWQQTWVTNRGSIMAITGTFKDGALIMEGEAHLADGRTVTQRITWQAQGQGVRESAVLSKDSGKTWTSAFDVLFLRHQDSPE